MQFRLRTLLIALTVLPPLLAGAWLWCRPLIAEAFILLVCQFFAAAILMAVLAVVGLVWAIAKRAVTLTRVLLRLTPQVEPPN